MRKSNLYTLLFLCVAMIAVMAISGIRKLKASADELQNEPAVLQDISEIKAEEIKPAEIETAATKETEALAKPAAVEETEASEEVSQETSQETTQSVEDVEISMDDALFIGDSRTVGLMEYAGIDGADFFCTVGMNVFEIYDEPVSVPGVGRMKLAELLDNKKYNKIYIMLGINELGYPFDQIVRKYGELVEFVKEKQPDAMLFMQANLHVTKSRSDRDKIFNNTNINKLNEVVKSFADDEQVYYLDANGLFDDSDGALSEDMSSDNAHLYARYYVKWGSWIEEETAALIKKGE